jgi:hypothetical protein
VNRLEFDMDHPMCEPTADAGKVWPHGETMIVMRQGYDSGE